MFCYNLKTADPRSTIFGTRMQVDMKVLLTNFNQIKPSIVDDISFECKQ